MSCCESASRTGWHHKTGPTRLAPQRHAGSTTLAPHKAKPQSKPKKQLTTLRVPASDSLLVRTRFAIRHVSQSHTPQWTTTQRELFAQQAAAMRAGSVPGSPRSPWRSWSSAPRRARAAQREALRGLRRAPGRWRHRQRALRRAPPSALRTTVSAARASQRQSAVSSALSSVRCI